MRPTRLTITIAFFVTMVLAAYDAGATPIFASPPHVVTDADGQRIVLFLNEPVSGALAARAGDGFEVRVPRSEVAPEIQGQDFGADGWGNGSDAVKHLVLAAGAKGDTSIRIETSGPVHGVDAYSVDDPPRLVIDLLAAAPTRAAKPTRTPAPTRTPVPGRASAHAPSHSAAPSPARSPRAKVAPPADADDVAVREGRATPVEDATAAEGHATSPDGARLVGEAAPSAAPAAPLAPIATVTARPHPTATATKAPRPTRTPRPRPTPGAKKQAEPHPTASAKPEPVAVAAVEPVSPEVLARATVLTATAPLAPPRAKSRADDVLAATAAGGESTNGGSTAGAPGTARTTDAHTAPGASGSRAAAALASPALETVSGSVGSGVGLGCLWRRFSGLAICLGDPKAPAYVGDHTVTAMVGALARGKLPEPEDTPAVATPALVYLEADVLFATRAHEGKLLPVVDAYRRALRQHPEFPEAWRARLNIALAYRAMEFLTELRTTAGEASADSTAGLVRGLAGDLAFVTEKIGIATDDYRRAADLGALGACLAARGRARAALAADDAVTGAAQLASLAGLCPSDIAADPETIWIRGQLALARHDVATARALLDEAKKGLGGADRGGVIADLGRLAETADDAKGARASYEQLLGGAFGARAARRATVRLAILDGVGGDVNAGLKRLDRLTPEASDPARRALVMQAARSALERGAPGDAIASLHEAHVDPTALGVDDQLLVAEAYRGIGLVGEAERVLAAAQANAGAAAPDALFAARGTLALDRRDGPSAAAIADDWIRARGRSGGALALRARAAALGGDAMAAHAAVAAAVMDDPSLTRTLALDVAETLRDRQPAAALILAREALEPGPTPELPPARAALGLALVGTLAEAAGDDDTALAAFTTLGARYGKEPVAADAAYRAARIAARRVPGGDAAAFDEAARSTDALARRVAGAARDYEAIVKPLAGKGGTQ